MKDKHATAQSTATMAVVAILLLASASIAFVWASSPCPFGLDIPSCKSSTTTTSSSSSSSGSSSSTSTTTTTTTSTSTSSTSGTISAPTLIASTTDQWSTALSNSKRTFFDQGFWWGFYSNGQNIYCVTLPASQSSWSIPTFVTSVNALPGYAFAIYNTPSNHGLYYAKAIGGAQFFYRYGTTSSGGCGSISWSIPETGVTVTNTGGIGVQNPSVSVDSVGNVWVLVQTSTGFGVPPHMEFWKGQSCGPLCFWTNTQDFGGPSQIRYSASYQGVIVPLTNGKMTAYFSTFNGGGKAYIQDWSGSAWSTPINMSTYTPNINNDPLGNYFEVADSCALQGPGDTSYFEGLAGGTFSITSFFKHTYGETTRPLMKLIISGAQTRDALGCLSWDGGSTIYAYYWTFWNFQNAGPATSIWYKVSTDGGNSFGPEILLTNQANTFGPKNVDFPLMPINGKMVIIFTDGFQTISCCSVKSITMNV